ncbi:myb-binding protein 1A-like protein isoform X2 [Megalops cyprinoides]|uniref:myb-binding protein 1A-like protein isoform X2 n=1 Tax=Megalops cyprinoides TaxID=118141 RepID=UPI0018649DBA|nr:myb-binding protein 1A-like protein isoform X2 [Megalops cyprinoides]
MATVTHADMGEIENEPLRPKITDAKGILKQNREFLDFFWDIAKPEQEIRLKAIENLIQYLKKSEKPDELKYTLKRLVDGLSHTRETARPGFSLALAQVLSVFEEISLQTALGNIKEKHDPQKTKKKLIRNAVFGNFFGVLALSQSGRLPKEPQVVLECVQLLQSLAQYREHLKDLPRKTMVDILSETTEEVFEEVLLGALQSDLSSAFSTPEQLQLLLVAMQRFPAVLKPKKLKKLLGSATVITQDNIPKLIEVLKMAARSVKKDRVLPAVALDLLQVALKEDSFELFWREVVVNGMLSDQSGPSSYMCYRLLGSAFPLLSLAQLHQVLSGEVMRHYGEHVVSAQLPDRFKFAPEMETYVGEFLQGCSDPEKQLAVMVGFTKLTNQGYPVVPSFWKVVQHMEQSALQSYVDWLKEMFLRPQLESCLDFSTRRQQENQESGVQNEHCVFRLRKWIIPRLTSIVENNQVKKEEDLVMDVARFVFFHAFFDSKKATPDIPESQGVLSPPFNEKTRAVIVNSFFGLLQHLNHRPAAGHTPETPATNEKRIQGVTADGTLWIYSLVQYANTLLSQTKYAQCAQPFTADQTEAWDRMVASVETLRKKAKKAQTAETSAFQQLFLLVGIQLFKAPEESVDLMQDLQNCLEKAQEKKSKKKKKAADGVEEDEPQWVEVVVEILLSLLSQPSRLIRQVCRTVFGGICPHVTQRALDAILDVLDPHKDEEESAVVVTDEKDVGKIRRRDQEEDDEEEDQEEHDEGCDLSEEDSDDDAMEEDEEVEEEEEEEVDQNFRLELMKVLQGQNALATEEDGSEDEELDDEAMMKLDSSIAALFSEQKKRIQAKKDEKERLRKEKALVRDFKIKVLDLVEVFLAKQSESPLVLSIIEPLLGVIESGMSSDTNQQEQDFLRKTADIFKNQLCKAKRYCRSVADKQEELHDMMERVLTRAQRLNDSSVSLYYFSASLYLLKVLRGHIATAAAPSEGKKESVSVEQVGAMGSVDVERVTSLFKEALRSFMTRRKSALSGAMFIDLFTRFPALCVRLLDTAVEYITDGVREHQQGQACAIVLRGLQTKEVRLLMTDAQWAELCEKTVGQVAESLKSVASYKVKVVQEKVAKALELSQLLIRSIQQQKLHMNLQPLKDVLEPMNQLEGFRKTGHMEDTYWGVMKHFGVLKPKVEKTKKAGEEQGAQKTAPKKKKGFLPETKKRKNRKKPAVLEGKEPAVQEDAGAGETGKKKKNKNKNKKKRKLEGGGEEPGHAAPKKAKAQPAGKPKKQKKKKQKQAGGE